ncbi:MAG: hypothetical protein MZV63_11610 [Marinilabiliales bacterium]|nr:hypothetical protein [Marinilabiliales bacterium]
MRSFFLDPIPGKIMPNDVEAFLRRHKEADIRVTESEFTKLFPTEHNDCLQRMFSDIRDFIVTEPKLPSPEREFTSEPYPEITVTDSRDDVIRKINELSGVSEMAPLTLHAYRDMGQTSWKPLCQGRH